MSYEYRLTFDAASSAQQVIDALSASFACVKAQGQVICLKDNEVQSASDYDIRLIQEDEKTFWMEVNFKSLKIYQLFQAALGDGIVHCFEDGDTDDEVTLKEAFRIKGAD